MKVTYALAYAPSNENVETLAERDTVAEAVRDAGNDMILHKGRDLNDYVIQEYLTDENNAVQGGRTLQLGYDVLAAAGS